MRESSSLFWYSVNGRMLRSAWKRPVFKVAVTFLVILIVLAVVMPLLSSNSATTISVRERFAPLAFMEGGSAAHLFGTDQLGRDLMLRSLIGLQNALLIGVASVFGMFVLGSLIGIISGYKGGWTDTILMRITDAQMSIRSSSSPSPFSAFRGRRPFRSSWS
ncbi:MAG: hypothetical protein R3C97_09365 [Geminicoccaceae bacterium]